jgi:hypothetical protein
MTVYDFFTQHCSTSFTLDLSSPLPPRRYLFIPSSQLSLTHYDRIFLHGPVIVLLPRGTQAGGCTASIFSTSACTFLDPNPLTDPLTAASNLHLSQK